MFAYNGGYRDRSETKVTYKDMKKEIYYLQKRVTIMEDLGDIHSKIEKRVTNLFVKDTPF